jgi:predicted enzyme related to lactoylglutathione lyase
MSTIAHFEIPFDEAERARKFYTELFGWTIEEFAPGMGYWMKPTPMRVWVAA